MLALLLTAGCGPSHRLADYTFSDRSAAVIAAIPPGPRVMSGSWSDAFVDPFDPIGTAVRIGTASAKWEQARKAQARLDSAAANVDVAEILARRALTGSAPILGLRPVDDPAAADFVLDLRVYEIGLVADSFEGATYFALEADIVLLDGQTRAVVWDDELREREVLTNALFGLPPAAGNVVTARALAGLSAEEMERGLARLAAFAADRVTQALREDFLEARATGS
ncbi:MAG: hypothetical protein AAGI91_00600 [Bacteroidota bacterium]